MKLKAILAGAALCVVGALAALAGGMFQTLPIVGGAQYCVNTVTTSTGQACTQYAPAGPATYAGTEVAPMDVMTPGTQGVGAQPQTVAVPILALGQGPMLDVTSPATATIPANTPFYILDGSQGSAFTITMPAAPVEGQFQWVVCEAATVGTLTVAANTGQTLKANPNAACVAGTTYRWRYQASNTTWYKV